MLVGEIVGLLALLHESGISSDKNMNSNRSGRVCFVFIPFIGRPPCFGTIPHLQREAYHKARRQVNKSLPSAFMQYVWVVRKLDLVGTIVLRNKKGDSRVCDPSYPPENGHEKAKVSRIN